MNITENRIEIGELVRSGAIVDTQDGNHGEKHPNANDCVDDGIPFIMANDVSDNFVDISATHKIPEPLAEQLRIGFTKDGDVLLTHKGTIGRTAIVEGADPYWMLTPQVTYYRTDAAKLDNYFLMCAFREPLFQLTMKSLSVQSTRPYIGITAQKKLKISYRPIDAQRRIVAALRPYDNLIRNNTRRINLLERSARLLFDEWFIRLRYPGHEHDKIVNGVPEGWERRTIPTVIDINPREPSKQAAELWYVPMSALSVSGMTLDAGDFERRSKHTGVKFRNGDTLFARITPCLENGKTGIRI